VTPASAGCIEAPRHDRPARGMATLGKSGTVNAGPEPVPNNGSQETLRVPKA